MEEQQIVAPQSPFVKEKVKPIYCRKTFVASASEIVNIYSYNVEKEY